MIGPIATDDLDDDPEDAEMQAALLALCRTIDALPNAKHREQQAVLAICLLPMMVLNALPPMEREAALITLMRTLGSLPGVTVTNNGSPLDLGDGELPQGRPH